ncbi:MAG: hypothetical protein A3H50_01430 [Candidatus Levybacteria bacterium RIFCSPLOWO2_02_FULL_37_10]|nr:MAG: hypothetical protein A2860_03145 [Candidatus Levybacteria bacterium RIFCSPHIGHO2_01_FULL_37_33]OGH16920.1 MAG: hypothetical protein A3C97_00180 [Candidatus Levybacteria bacterium RIFCSPHIGHO2_02_FULL_37_11]OGH29864.1 MAG: hypothetical protein A3F30_01585 [Candidatus Levybacteria bacterium RIFCSPHIGHO2_12_FULL_37_12]OGH32970.1 MAG: hypothetical protein A2953_00945 [Candidatus Levybacteria bacterium RIFCSPLOWO2_01_FULL_36_54]OGH43333.1 MAG: hypothetical protein A3H50_01430 [Candidatus Lev
MTYQNGLTREQVIRHRLTKEEVISRITEIYHAGYDLNSEFDVWDQLLACESLAGTEAKEQESYGKTKEDVSVKWSVNDIYKQNTNFELTESKQKAIVELETFTYETPPIKIAQLLEILFAEYNSKNWWWLVVAQQWNPRAINRVIKRMIKLHTSGVVTIQNPAAYFTYLIKLRKKRRSVYK